MFKFFFDTAGFPARWDSGSGWNEQPWLGWMHIGADVATGLAYIGIPVLMILAMRRVKHLPAPSLLVLFAIFILACGSVHLIEALIFWVPVYRISAVAKLVTAISSCLTVGALAYYWPRLLQFRSETELREEVDRQTEQLTETAIRLHETSRNLKEQKERLGLALAAGTMGTWDWNLESDEVQMDASEIAITGLEGRPMPDSDSFAVDVNHFFEIVHEEDRSDIKGALAATIAKGVPYNHSFRIVTTAGKVRWLLGRGSLISEPGKPRRIVGINYDITSQKRFEEDLAAARLQAEAASDAKSRFLANTSHEIRTPLTAILGCAESLSRDAPDEATGDMASLIQRQGQLLQRLLDDVLDLSRIEAGRLTVNKKGTCDLHGLLEDVRSLMQPLAIEKDLSFELAIDSRVPRYVRTDTIRFRQVVLNLVSNAIKYTDTGSVRLGAEVRNSQEDQVELVVTVNDTGRGIAIEQQALVFEAFQQARNATIDGSDLHSINRGVGLGLAISSKLMQLLGGRLGLTSKPNLGSMFSIHLPVKVIEAAEVESKNSSSGAELVKGEEHLMGRLLVAEDTPSIQFLLRKLLARHATSIDVVADGRAAVDSVHQAIADGRPYDLVLLDMHMPELSGYSVARRLRGAGIETPIIALTASAMVGDREHCLEAGCSAYVPKPIDWELLESEVQRGLRQ